MTNEPTDRRRLGRTRLWTTASIVAVAATGALAIGANMGILSAAGDNNDVGTLSAADDPTLSDDMTVAEDLAPAEPQVVDVYLNTPAEADSVAANPAGVTTDTFTVDDAGTFSFRAADAQLRLDGVSASSGWTWVLTQSADSELAITLTDGVRTLEVVALLGEDGRVALAVTEPTAGPGSAEPTVSADSEMTTGDYSDDDDDDEHEGRDDDD